jgi:hypothetical protein
MKIKITFDTSDPDQRLEHLQMIHALPALGALYDFQQYLKIRRDHIEEEDISKEHYKLYDEQLTFIVQAFNTALEDNGINLETLYP